VSETPPGGQQSVPQTTLPHTPGLAAYGPSQTQTNNLAVVSFVAAIASFFAHVVPVVGGVTVAIIAIVTGFMARGQIKRTGEQGMWMANLGIIIGVVHLALGVIVVIVILLLIAAGVALFTINGVGGSTPGPVTSP
jgi:chromate transport protein ChrA